MKEVEKKKELKKYHKPMPIASEVSSTCGIATKERTKMITT
jgi:hypothetical protein